MESELKSCADDPDKRVFFSIKFQHTLSGTVDPILVRHAGNRGNHSVRQPGCLHPHPRDACMAQATVCTPEVSYVLPQCGGLATKCQG